MYKLSAARPWHGLPHQYSSPAAGFFSYIFTLMRGRQADGKPRTLGVREQIPDTVTAVRARAANGGKARRE
jgi:hypothetical protein